MAARRESPMRTCVVCGRNLPQAALLRLALSAGRVVADQGRRLPGRGAYVCPRPACLAGLEQRKPPRRAFRGRLDPAAWQGLAERIRLELCAQPPHDSGRLF